MQQTAVGEANQDTIDEFQALKMRVEELETALADSEHARRFLQTAVRMLALHASRSA